MSKDIALSVKKKVSIQEQKALDLVIKTDEDMEVAVVMLSEANKALDAIKDEKDKIIKPAKEVIDTEKARWKPIEDICSRVVSTVRGKMMEYQKKIEAKVKEREEAIAKSAEKGKIKPETAMKKMEALPNAAASVTTGSGMVQWTTVKKLVIENEALIPREYLDVNEARVREALKTGKVVPGAKLIEEKIPKNFR